MKKKTSIFLIGLFIFSIIGSSITPASQNIEKASYTFDFKQIQLVNKDQRISVEFEETNSFLMESGKPMLPVLIKTFTFPSNTKIIDVHCNIGNVQKQFLIEELEYSPQIVSLDSLNPVSKKPLTKSDEPYPNSWYNYKVGHGLIDGTRSIIVKVELYPVNYDPSDNSIRWSNNINIEIEYERTNSVLVQNEEHDLLILSPADLAAELHDLVTHKNNIGISTKHVWLSEIYDSTYFPVQGRDDPEKIKYFIKDAYENWGITNVLIVGGIDYFPSRETHVQLDGDNEIFVSDIYYADIYDGDLNFATWDSNENDIFAEYNWDGNTDEVDLYPDVRIGRIACIDSNQVTTIVNKIITYETTIAYAQDWFSNLVVIGGDTFPGDEKGVDEGELVNQAVMDALEGFSNDIIWDSNNRLSGLSPTGVQNINNGINDGCGFVDFSGHGAPWVWTTYPHNGSHQSLPTPTGSYTSNLISELSNGDKLPIAVCGGCSLGKFTSSANCFAWAFLSNPNGGGIASFGATGLGYVYIGEWATYGLVEGLNVMIFESYGNGAITFGEVWIDAVNMYHEKMTDLSGYDYKTLEEWHPFGDPTLQIAPESLKPNTPNPPEGPSSGTIDEEYTYTASTTDPEGDELDYFFDWGDGTDSGWIGPKPSGQSISASHSFSKRGSYEIRVKARDEHGSISSWSDPLQVSMPKNKGLHLPFFKIFENYPFILYLLENYRI